MIGPRRVLVTGAGRRIGAGLSIALAEAGWHVVLHYNQAASEAQTLCETLTAAGRIVELVQADLAKPDDIDKLMEQARSSGPLDAVINNASLFAYDDSDTISASEIDRHMAVNVTAPALLIRALNDQMPEGKQGAVINMLDAKLFGINPDYFSYTLSKSACHTLTQIAAQAYAPRLRVNGIAPGIVLPSGGQTEEEFQLSHKRNLLGQGALMKEIVAAMHLLLDTRSITGEVIILDGGAHLQPPARDVAFL